MKSWKAEIPAIYRARDSYLYAANGQRYLDLFLDGGLAWMGHRTHSGRIWKAIWNRGLLAAYPHFWNLRFEKLFFSLFGEVVEIFLYRQEEKLFEHLREEGYDPGQIAYPWEEKKLLNLFLSAWQGSISLPAIWAMPLPRALPLHAWIKPAQGTSSLHWVDSFADPLSSFLAHQAILEVKKFRQQAQDKNFRLFDEILWKRHGRYLQNIYPQERHHDIWQTFLAAGILLPPRWEDLALCPLKFSHGDLKLLRQSAELVLKS